MRQKTVLIAALVFLALLTASRPGDRGVDLRDMERDVYKKINAYRAGKGLDQLGWDDRLADQARVHSVAMARGKRGFGHGGFNDRIEATRVQFTSAAENVGQNQGFDDPADQAVEGWLDSDGHRTNIEGRYNLTGVGVARSRNGTLFFTQIFMLAKQEK
ncbi:MAG: CAP domain-containing protein [Acidobacteria bacterium]|nr:MAG: CAP domain-containing protein [Acidobacteriota bacterium]